MTLAADRPARAALPLGAILILVVLMASWGFNLVTVKLAMSDLTAAQQTLVRAVVATACLVLIMGARRERIWAADETLRPGLAAGFVFGVNFLIIFGALAFTTAAKANVFLYTMPFFMTGLAVVFLPGEALDRRQLAGLAAAFGGIALAFADGFAAPSGSLELIGDLMMVAAAALWAVNTLIIKRSALARAPASRVLWYQMALSIPISALAVWISGAPWPVTVSAVTVAALAYQSLWVALVTYALWYWLVARHPAPLLSAYSFMTPIFGILFGHLVLGEAIGWTLGLAVALVCGGIVLVNRPRAAG